MILQPGHYTPPPICFCPNDVHSFGPESGESSGRLRTRFSRTQESENDCMDPINDADLKSCDLPLMPCTMTGRRGIFMNNLDVRFFGTSRLLLT